MTKEIYQSFVKNAPDVFHTVAPLTYHSAEVGVLPLIALEDIEDGCARCLGADTNVNLSYAKLPALLIHEYALGQCVMLAIWHRDETQTEMNAGARISIRTRDELLASALTALNAVDKDICLNITNSQVQFSYENAYQAVAVSIPFTYDGACIRLGDHSFSGQAVALPDFVPTLY